MQRTHCDVCGEEIRRDRGHIWANTLPEGDPVRNLSAKIQFFGARKTPRDRESDVCEDCMFKFLRGIRGVLDPTKD